MDMDLDGGYTHIYPYRWNRAHRSVNVDVNVNVDVDASDKLASFSG